MNARVQKWGNSLAIRIPKPFATEIGLDADAPVDVALEKGRLVITPASKPTYHLAKLLQGVTRSNRHKETRFGRPQGREVW
jgi:antitoxin MazE